jgi:antitoxin HigA-1
MARLIIHPGEHLADELQALGMSANELAKALGVPTNRITEIIRGKRGISGDTALRLGRWFGTGPDIWMNLQKNYELRLAAEAIGEGLEKIPEHQSKAKEMKQQGDNSPPQP